MNNSMTSFHKVFLMKTRFSSHKLKSNRNFRIKWTLKSSRQNFGVGKDACIIIIIIEQTMPIFERCALCNFISSFHIFTQFVGKTQNISLSMVINYQDWRNLSYKNSSVDSMQNRISLIAVLCTHKCAVITVSNAFSTTTDYSAHLQKIL